MTLHVTVDLPAEVLDCLKKESLDRQVPVDVVVSDVLSDYFDEMTESEILERARRGLQQALAGNYRPALEVLDEIDCEYVADADHR